MVSSITITIYIIVHDTWRRNEEGGKRKRGRYPFQNIVHFSYICSVSRLLHGGRRYLKICLPGGGGSGRVRCSFYVSSFPLISFHRSLKHDK